MRPNPWILPASALLVTGAWIVAQEKSATTLEHEISLITGRIVQMRTGKDAVGNASKDKEGKIDWKNLTTGKSWMLDGANKDERAIMRLQQQLSELPPEKLGAQLDEIAAMDLDHAVGERLRVIITGVLFENGPQILIERLENEIEKNDSNTSLELYTALENWAETNPVAASAWLDKQIAAGKFESKVRDRGSRTRSEFEGALVNVLLATDPVAAAARVAALPERQRSQLFYQFGGYLRIDAENDAAYTNLVRGSLSEHEITDILAGQAGYLSHLEGYKRVDSYIASVRASDDEKKMIVAQVMAQKIGYAAGLDIKLEDVEQCLAWAANHSPGYVDKGLGEILATTLRRREDFNKASALVLQYNERGGNDEILTTFLRSRAIRDYPKEQLDPLIDKIKNPGVREEIRNLK